MKTKHNSKVYQFSVFLLFIVLFNNCFLEFQTECSVDIDRLQLPHETFPEATIDKSYSHTICYTGMERDRNFEGWTILYYNYDYSVYGELPDGIIYIISNGCITFSGTPEETGSFEFNVYANVNIEAGTRDTGTSSPEETKIECYESESEKYTIHVK